MNELDEIPDDPFAMILDLGENKKKRQIIFNKPEVKEINAIVEELRSFKDSVVNNLTPPVSIQDGYMALDVAQKVLEKIYANSNNI